MLLKSIDDVTLAGVTDESILLEMEPVKCDHATIESDTNVLV